MANKLHIFFHIFFNTVPWWRQWSNNACDFYSIYFGWDIKQRELHIKTCCTSSSQTGSGVTAWLSAADWSKLLWRDRPMLPKPQQLETPRVNAPGQNERRGKSDHFWSTTFTWIRYNIMIWHTTTIGVFSTVYSHCASSFLGPLVLPIIMNVKYAAGLEMPCLSPF